MREHELRKELNDELHGRPGLPVHAPARITHLAFTVETGDGDPLEHVKNLCDGLGVKAPAARASHHAVLIAGGMFKFERHGEFYRISVTAEKLNDGAEAITLLPIEWFEKLPGKRLVGIHTHILRDEPTLANGKKKRLVAPPQFTMFGHDELACSNVNQGMATVWSDFWIRSDGYTRMLILDHGMSALRLGRLTRRLHEIETYRMMALLSLPLARALQQQIGPLEAQLSATIKRMSTVGDSKDDAKLLAELSGLARDVEEFSNRSSYRFAASRAYTALVSKRIAELGEERVMSYQRLGVFLDRRYSPAMATCTAVADRLTGLAERCERASNLLRTRVDIALEDQNQQLLRSLETSSRRQLSLQQTVEGLSVVAISYYAISIFAKLVDGVAAYLPAINSEVLKLTSIPVILVGVWYGLRRLRKRLR
jgi:uncharacterized membrane-anchored protein